VIDNTKSVRGVDREWEVTHAVLRGLCLNPPTTQPQATVVLQIVGGRKPGLGGLNETLRLTSILPAGLTGTSTTSCPFLYPPTTAKSSPARTSRV